MSKSIESDTIYRSVNEVLTNNYTANLFSNLERENLAKKIAHKLDNILGNQESSNGNVATHMGDQIIQDENRTDNLITKEKAEKMEKENKDTDEKSEEVEKPTSKKSVKKSKSKRQKTRGLSNLNKK